MDPVPFRFGSRVIDLVSDDEEEADESGSNSNFEDAMGFDDEAALNDFLDLDGGPPSGNLIDLTGLEDIPDIDVPPDTPPFVPADEDIEFITEAVCLQMVLNVLPDISVDHVLDLINERGARTVAECERLITKILDDGQYPKESDDVNQRKRKRSEDDGDGDGDSDITDFEKGQQGKNAPDYHTHALNLLKDEFLDVPLRHIESTLNQKKTLFDSYLTLEHQLREYNRISSMFRKINKPRVRHGYENALAAAGNNLPKELQAAKKKSEREAAKRLKESEKKSAEEANFLQAQIQGETADCLCCFDEFAMNRMITCGGDTMHIFCRDCAKKYVEEEIGKMKCRPVCFADASCGGTFTRSQLQSFLGEKTFERLEHLQQQEDLRDAGLDFLDECPFCDFKAECLPVEIDKEFRCQNPKCGKTSCRLCHKETHIPKTCDEVKKDDNLSVRHKVEEAKSEALIRHCNRCKNPFVKEFGCNKMTCTKCHNMQCYVCSKNIKNYDHFGNGRCPLHDNQEDRHEQEVQKAEAEALAKIRQERPDISEEELKIEVSDRVKRAEQARRGQAQNDFDGFDFFMDGNQLRAGRRNAHPDVGLFAGAGVAPVPPVAPPNPFRAIAPIAVAPVAIAPIYRVPPIPPAPRPPHAPRAPHAPHAHHAPCPFHAPRPPRPPHVPRAPIPENGRPQSRYPDLTALPFQIAGAIGPGFGRDPHGPNVVHNNVQRQTEQHQQQLERHILNVQRHRRAMEERQRELEQHVEQQRRATEDQQRRFGEMQAGFLRDFAQFGRDMAE